MPANFAYGLTPIVLCSLVSFSVAKDLRPSTVYIQVGYVDNGVFNKVAEGSGFIITATGDVVTAKHLVEEEVPAGQKRVFYGAVGSSAEQKFELSQPAGAVTTADIAVLRFSPALLRTWMPLKISANHRMSLGDNVSIAGFPLRGDFTLKSGQITSLVGNAGAIQVGAGLAPGMSGGPVVLTSSGCVIGLVAGGSFPTFDYFTPIGFGRSLLESTSAEYVSEVSASPTPAGNTAPLFDRAFQVDETKDDHGSSTSSKYYERTFSADPKSMIVSARFVETSAAAASDKLLNISADRASATFRFRLESGPFYDQWRGWWHGQIVLTEQSTDVARPPVAASCE
jgi:hypothetical protein